MNINIPARKKKKKVKTAKELLLSTDWFTRRAESAKYVTKEYQDFGLRLAKRLNDMEHRSLYIKLAKVEDRNLLERAIMFSSDYHRATSKARVFMWKLKELKTERAEYLKEEEEKEMEKQLGLI